MVCSLVQYFWANINNQKIGLRLLKLKFRTESWNIVRKKSDSICWSFVKIWKEKYLFFKYQTEKEILNLKVERAQITKKLKEVGSEYNEEFLAEFPDAI